MLRDHAPGYQPFDERCAFLFNSYYEGEGPRHARPQPRDAQPPLARRGPRLSRARRRGAGARAAVASTRTRSTLVELGINHEQQHQELFLTDILATFAENPLEPAYGELPPPDLLRGRAADLPCAGREGIVEIGARRRRLRVRQRAARATASSSRAHALASRRVTNGEWREFIADGGYRHARRCGCPKAGTGSSAKAIAAPLYWRERRDRVHARRPARDRLGRAGRARQLSTKPTRSPAGPARGSRPRPNGKISPPPPTRTSATSSTRPAPVVPRPGGGMFGDVWEWTQSAFASYPGFAPAEGAVGEYNGKFMCGQFVLKGASCATPRGHSRASYRNFFPPGARWQFTGLRLARDA